MADSLRFLAMLFYAPLRGIREVRDRGALLPTIICAYLSQVAYVFAVSWLAGDHLILRKGAPAILTILFHGASSLLPFAILLAPLVMLVANLFERRGSFGVVMQQEYGSLASVTFYVLTAINIFTIFIAAFFHFSGVQAAYVTNSLQHLQQSLEMARSMGFSPETMAQTEQQLSNPVTIAGVLFLMTKLALLTAGIVTAVRIVFRASILRSIAIVILSGGSALMLSQVLYGLFHTLLASPLLLLFAFFLLRGFFSDIVGTQRARTAFKQNLEAATINPRDASAHYNLGLIHQNRGELDLARERFQRAIDIDADEWDAHYQLGRIARAQNRPAEAIGHFEQVVQNDQTHAQYEIWREIGATYLAAGQFSDARDTLERFIEHRTHDPQALYLMGRAHAGLGDSREAVSSMEACIEAVKTAPAYKYRTEKRWLNEAQQFMKASKAVGSRQ